MNTLALDRSSAEAPSDPVIDAPAANKSTTAPAFSFSLELRRAGGGAEIEAQSYRVAARLNVSKITHKEREELLQERQVLLKKKLTADLSSSDQKRLAYVRWSLDRIEDARHGDALDALEKNVDRYAQVLRQVQQLQQTLASATNRKK